MMRTALLPRIGAILAALGALAAVAAAIRLPELFRRLLILQEERWFLAALGMALAIAAFSLWRRAVLYAVLVFWLFLGGAAQLYLTEPLWYPALRFRLTGPIDRMMVGLIAIEVLVAVAVLIARRPHAILADAGARLGRGRIAVVLVLSAAFSVSVMGYIPRHAFTAYLAHVAVGGVLIVAHLTLVLALTQVRGPFRDTHRLSPVAPAVLTVVLASAMAWLAFERLPHVEDEVAYLFQAQTFAGGALTAPAPPEAALPGLDYYLLAVKDGRWFSVTAPGWPAVLALGALAGVPWLVNPLLAGLAVLLAAAITRRVAGRDQADLLALLMATSPWLIGGAATMMTHSLTLALVLFAWWCVLRADDPGRRAWRQLLMAGLALGWAFATRSLDGLVMGVVTGVWVLFGPRGSVARAAVYSLGCVLTGSLALAYNWAFTGSLARGPLDDYLVEHWKGGSNAYGFGPGIGPPGGWGTLDVWPGHSPLEGLVNTVNNITELQFEMLGWSVGSLILVYAFLVWQKPRLFDRAMVAVVAIVALVMFFYWFAGTFYIGPRYWYLTAFPLLFLSVRGFDAITARLGTDAEATLRLTSIVWVLCLFGVMIFMPWRGVTKYYQFGTYHSSVRHAEEAGNFGNAIVLVGPGGDVGSALFLNDPWLPLDRPIYLADREGLDVDALRKAFPGRPVIRFSPSWQTPKPGIVY